MGETDVRDVYAGDVLSIHREGSTAILRLHGPPANAMHSAFVTDLDQAYAILLGAGDVRSLLIVSDLDVFSLGGDLKLLVDDDPMDDRFRRGIQRVFNRLETLPFPVICAIDGHALGGGFELALACDLRVVRDDPTIKLGLPESQLGLFPGAGGTQRLTHLVGRARALDLLFSGRDLDPETAYSWGLVTTLVDGSAEEAAHQMATELAAGPTTAYGAIKACVHEAAHGRLDRGLAVEREQARRVLASEDAAEGMRAFVERRRPTFRGR